MGDLEVNIMGLNSDEREYYAKSLHSDLKMTIYVYPDNEKEIDTDFIGKNASISKWGVLSDGTVVEGCDHMHIKSD